ncbi:LEPR-XLL domain-containing protein [Ensifer sp. SSB1]|uniref:LEPR-XLL domain-containing protein n=1 Tax=Ensifer sp. SSB1 TaxID=2795385 RepID=UPI001A5CC224|nr:LEPR-XLL domain-containing protein [Ensifer sp. SSB1]MBK5565795.1 LEPR-XLL domain-containing protein [Ensifer sp. SSB1]
MIERLFRWFGGRKARGFTPRSETNHLPGLALETLEPRYLLSADIMPFAVDMVGDGGADYSLRYDNLIQAVQVYDNRSSLLVAQRNAAQIDYIRVTGTAANDTLTIDFGTAFLQALDIDFQGGDGDDKLSLTGGVFDLVEFASDGAGSGVFTAVDGQISHRIGIGGVSTVTDATTAQERIFADVTGEGQTLRLSDSGTPGDGFSTLDSINGGALVSYTFASPNLKLTIDTGAGDDTFVHNGFDNAISGKVLLSGGAGSDAVIGPPVDTNWNITGLNAGNVSGVSFVEVENLRGSADNEDTFFVSAGGGLTGVMDGGAGGFDSLVLDGGVFQSVTYVATGPASGTITRDGQVLRYDGLEPITDNTVVADRIIATSDFDDEARLKDNGDGTLTLESLSLIPTFEKVTFAKPTNSLTIKLGADLGIPLLSKDVLTVTGVNLGAASFTVFGENAADTAGDDGKDEVLIEGTNTFGAVVVHAEKITVSGNVSATTVTLVALAEDDGKITGGAYFATPEAIIDLSGATITASGAVQISATADATVSASTADVGPLEGVIVTVLPEARIKFDNSTLTAASLSAGSSVSVSLTAADEGDASENDTTKDAAVSVTVVLSDSITEVLGGSALNVSGAVSLTADTQLALTTTADGGSGSKGASVAVSEVNATTRAYMAGNSALNANSGDLPDSVAFSATLTSNVSTTAISSAGGSNQGDGTSESEKRLADPNQDSNTSDKAATSGGDITFAGAVTVSDYRTTTEAYIDSSILVSASTLALTATSTESVTAGADGSATASAGTGVGVAVALGIADVTTRAYVAGTSDLTASAVDVNATLNAGESFVVTAEAGAGGAETNVAGALAISIIMTDVEAVIEAGASVNLHGGDLSLTASSTTHAETAATPNGADLGEAGETGIGGSVALAVIDNNTNALIENSATVTAADDVTLSATGNHESETTAEAGGTGGSTGIGGAVAIDVIDNTTRASLGTDDVELDITGDFLATATHHGLSTTTADGTAIGSTAVGAAIALAFVDNRAISTTNRNLRADGSVSLSALGDGSSKAEARASAKGADKNDESADGNTKADQQKQKQVDFANSKSGDADSTSQTANTGGGSGGDVGVAAALAINVSDSEALASIGNGRTVTAGDGAGTGGVNLQAKNNMDASAIADGSATLESETSGTAVGAAVAINVADMSNRAIIGNGAIVNADGSVTLSATMKNAGGDQKNIFEAHSTSGASGGDTGVAGSFALNVSDATAEAAIRPSASVTLGSDDASLTVSNTSESSAVAEADAESASTGVGASFAINAADNTASAKVGNAVVRTGLDDLTLSATGSHKTTTTAESGATAEDGTGVGGAIAITVADNVTEAKLGTGGLIDLDGAFSATATHHGESTTSALGDALAGNTAVGAAIALAFVDDSATATTVRNITADGNVSFAAHGDGASTAEARASAAGADKDKETDSGNTTADDQKNKQKQLANEKSGKSNTGDKSATSQGGTGGGQVSVAAALAINVSSSLAVASIGDGVTIIAGQGAGTGALQLHSSNNMNASAAGDGQATTTSSGTGVGVAVAINVATMRNEASVGAGAHITADGLTASATMKTVSGNAEHDFGAESTSGASGGDTGVAGSFALSVATTNTLGTIGLDHGGGGTTSVTLTGGNVSLQATNTTKSTTEATAHGAGSGSGSTGVGASIALGISLNTTFAGIENGETISGNTGNFQALATSNDTVTTTAKAGAAGNTAVGGAIAVAYVDNDTDAHIGSGAGGAITLTGNLAAQASHASTIHTLGDGEAAGSNVGVGVSLALNIAEVTNDAFVGRNFSGANNVSVTATSTFDTKAESKASAKGNDTSKANSDQESSNQTNMAQNQSGGSKAPTQSGSSSLGTADSKSTNETGKSTQGGTSVAATIAVNFLDADNTATIASNVVIGSSGAMEVEATMTTDARALGTATSTNTSSNTGVAAAVGLNIALLDNTAQVNSGADLTAGSIQVRAVTAEGQKNTFQARALAGAVSKNTAVGGSVAVNYLDVNSSAIIGNNADLDANAGGIAINAVSVNEMQSIAGGAALSLNGGTGVGVAVSINIVNDLNTKADVGTGVDAEASGAIGVTAHAELLPITESIPVIGNLAVTSFAAGVAASNGTAVGGSSSVNVVFMETHAFINDGSDFDGDGGVTVEATDILTMVSGAGGIGLSGGSNAGVGIGLDVNVIIRNTSAWVGGTADLGAIAGNILVNADSFDTITSIAATFGLSLSGSGVAASVGVVVLDTSTEAYVETGTALDKSEIHAGGNVSLKATGDAKIFALAGGIAFGQGAGIGIGGTVFVHIDDVKAEIRGHADVETGGPVGLDVSAISTEDVTTIAAAGGVSASSAAVAGSVAVTVLTETTIARIGSNTAVTAQSGANDPGVAVYAYGETDLLTVAGSLAASGGSAAVGAGVNIATLIKTTQASIDSGMDMDADGNIKVEATSSEDVGSFSVAAGGASSAAITVSADVFIFDVKTRAFIGDDPIDGIGNAGLTDVRALGSVLVQAVDETELDLIVGGVAVGGSAGVGVAAGVAVVDKVTESFIGEDARVTGEGHHSVAARTGRFDISFAGSQSMGDGYDPQTDGQVSKDSLEAGVPIKQGGGGLGQFNDLDQDESDDGTPTDPGLTQQRTATASVDSGFRGVAVSASTKDDIETAAISVGGGGSVGVAVGAAVNVVNTTTSALIGEGARINQDMSGGGNGAQSVLVAAASDFSHLGVGAGAAVGGSAAAAPAVDVSVVTTKTTATIGDDTLVDANNDVAVIATAKEKVLVVSAGLALSGAVSLAGGVSVVSIDADTFARIGDSTVEAGGDVAVMAKDDSQFTIVSGAVAIGLSGGGAAGSVGVVHVTKDTEATIGEHATIDARANGAGLSNVLDGGITTSGGDPTGFSTLSGEAHGVIVQAQSSEVVTHIAVAGAGGLYVGIAGAVSVTIIDSDTLAAIGAGAAINQGFADYQLHPGNVGLGQGVYVNAANDVRITSFAGSAAVGFVGIGGGIDFGSIKNDTTASIGANADILARNDVAVSADSIQVLKGFAFSGVGGVVGLGASVSVWSIGQDFKDDYANEKEGTSGDATTGGGDNAAADAGEKTDGGVGELTGQMTGFSGDGNSRTADSRVRDNMQGASDRLNDPSFFSGADLDAALIPTNEEHGTTATIEAGADVEAGHDILVVSRQNMKVDLLIGNAAAGLVGAGAAVTVLNVSGQVKAKAGGNLSAGNQIKVEAELDEEVDVTTVAFQGGFVGLGASVIVINDTSRVQARLLDGTVVDGASLLSVSASNTQDFDVTTTGIQIGAVAAGASYVDLNIGDTDDSTIESLATIGAGSQIGQTDAVGAITVHADSTVDAKAETFALAGGALGLSFNFALIDVETNIEASILGGANIDATGTVTLEALSSHNAKGDVFALTIGLGAVGTSFVTVNVVPTTSALIGGNSTITAGGIVILASHNFLGATATDRGAKAFAEASGGGLFSGQGAVPTARSNAVVTASIGAGGALTITNDIDIKSRLRNYAVANTEANSFGAAAVGATDAEAVANGQSNASVNANIVSVRDIGIDALAVNGALAVAEATGGGVLGALTLNSATATASPSSVAATIGNNTSIQSARHIRLKALANTEGDSKVVGVTIGGVFGAGDSDATTNVNPTVSSTIGTGSVINATGTVSLEAIAAPIPGTQPDYAVIDADGAADTITVNNHGLVTGDTVEYDAGSGGAVIPGLNWPDPQDPAVNRQYNVINVVDGGNVDPNKLYFGSTFDAASIDSETEIITFQGAHNFISGDAVRYYAGPDETVNSFGLTEGNLYYVLVIDESHIKLVDTHDKAVNPQNYFKNFQPDDIAGNQITISGHGFTNGMAVTYDAPDPKTFVSRQVDVNPTGLNPDGSPIDDGSQNNIRFFDDNGNALNHGFSEGEHVVYNVETETGAPGTAIVGLSDGQTYRVHVVNSTTIQLKHNDVVTEQVQFVRNAGGDRIVRTDGENWADFGFGTGTLFISGAGANSGTYTVTGVSGSTLILSVVNSVTETTLTKTFDQSIITLTPNKAKTADDIHSLINAKNLPIGGLEDGKTYYVRGVSGPGDDTFELWDAPTGGTQMTLTPTGLSGPYANHRIGALAVDISSDAASEQQLRIDINNAVTSVAGGQFLFGPGRVSLSEIAPQSGDGVSSAYSKGSGGGFVGVNGNDANITSNPNVTATISATLVTTSGDVSITTSATTNTTAHAVNGTGGFVAVGDADANSYQDVNSVASVGDGTRIVAGKNVTVTSSTNVNTGASSHASAGGAVGVASPTTVVWIEYNSAATIGADAIVVAGELAKLAAYSEAGVSANATGSGIGFGGDGDAVTHVYIGIADPNPDPDQADTIATLGDRAVLSAKRAVASAKVGRFDIFSGSDGRGAGFYGEGQAESTLTARPKAEVHINADSELTGWEGVDLVTRYDNVKTHAKSYARATGLFGFVDSDAHNDTDVASKIFGAAGALVTAGPRDNGDAVLGHPDYPQEPAASNEHLALYASTVNGSISQTDDADYSKRSLAAGGSDGSSPDDRPQQIDFNSDVLILSGRSPELVVKQLVIGADGQIDVAVEVTVNDSASGGGNSEGEGDTIQSDDIVVNDIVNPGPGDVVFDSKEMVGSGGTWTFRDTLQRVTIRNESDKDIIINNIDVVTDEQPLAWLNPSNSVTLTFNIEREVAPTLIEITDTGGRSDIYINGTIENPIGTTSIVNTDGSVFATNDRGVTGSDGRQSLIRTHILNIRAD